MVEIKHFSGKLNLDDRPENISMGEHIDSLNLRFYGGANGLTAQNIPGNTLISNSLPTGTNECIGAFYDAINQRIYWLNFNSNGRNGIYRYNISSATIEALLVSFTNSQSDIFGFSLDYPATDMHIIYTTTVDGDILDWNTRNKRPKTLNILQAEQNIYGANWLESYLDVAKEPFDIPPPVAYEDDATAIVNNVRKKLFKFKSRGWFADNEKTTWGSISEVPVPFNYNDPQVDTDPTKNSRIGVVVQTGDVSVRKIEIAAQENLNSVWGNFFSCIILDKDELSIPDNDVYLWRFYNSEAYPFIDLDESILQFDRVPDRANAQELLNGNVRVYGGITEGLDPVVPDVSMVTDIEYPLQVDCNNVMSVTQYGTNGFQIGKNIHFVVIGTIRRGQTFNAYVQVGGSFFTITYTAVTGDTPATVLVGLSASATGQGFTQVSISAKELIISRTNQVLLRHNITTTDQSISATFNVTSATNIVKYIGGAANISLFFKGVQFYLYGNLLNVNPFTVVSSVINGSDLDITVSATLANEVFVGVLYFVPPLNDSIPSDFSSSRKNYGIMYFDEKGKTNGVTTSPDFNVITKYLGMQKSVNTLLFYTPFIQATVRHRPPLWAKTFQWVRSKNLTKENVIDWVSDRTYKDDKFAYISIESINAYKKINPNSIISYDFLPGDRISFYVLFNSDGTPNTLYTQGTVHDYEIYSQEVNPDINGIVRTGQFLKIVLPTTSSTFDFSNGITLTYSNYYIELYTPAKAATEGLDVYYEFSEEYGIGNWGTATAFHQGWSQNQSADLVTPAIFRFNKGDAWYRTRLIDIGNVLRYDIVSSSVSLSGGLNPKPDYIFGQKLTLEAYSTTDYIASTLVTENIVQNVAFVNPNWTINGINNTYTFHVTGVINITMVQFYLANLTLRILVDTTAGGTVYDLDVATAPLAPGQQVAFSIDELIVVPPGARVYLYIHPTNNASFLRFNVVSGWVNYSEPKKQFEVGVIDENFSDFFESKVNSNGRTDTVHPDEKTNFFGTLLRWGLAYQQNTNINQVNRFMPLNFDEIDRSKGDIQRFKSRDRILRVFQNRGVGQFGVLARFIQNNQGDSQLVTTNEIITKGNISYYAGEYGLGDQYSGLVSAVRADYFVDPVRGYQVRLSDDGFTPISEIYKGQFYIRNLLTPYNQNYLRTNGSKSKILGCYDYFDEQYVCLLQEGVHTTSQSEYIIPSYVFSFNERRNGYCSFYSYKDAEWLLSAEDVIYSWKNGQLYSHNNTTNYCNFFGAQYGCYITVVFNVNLFEKKTPESISELASTIWKCPIIYSNVQSYAGQRQETNISIQEFKDYESMFAAALRRDIHSRGGKINGSFMKGNWLAVQFRIDDASDLSTLSEVQLKWIDSSLTVK